MNILLAQRRWRLGESANNPIALLDIAPVARGMGEVDCHWLGEIPRDKQYDMVGFSILMDYPEAMQDVRRLRKRFRNASIVVGGKWAQSLDAEREGMLRAMPVEVWKGPGEQYFGKEVSPDQPSWNPRDLFTLRVNKGGVMSARGCPYHCAFCNNTETKITRFSPKRTIDNVEALFDRKIKRVFFVDDVFTANANHMVGIYEEAQKRKVPLVGRNMFFTHVRHITDRAAKAMERLNPTCVQIGIESGDNGMLNAMQKGFTSDEALAAVQKLSEHVRGVTALFLIGFPGETVQSLRATMAFARRAAPYITHVWVSLYQPIPGTVGYDLALEHGEIVGVGLPNTRIGYIDRNLTAAILRHARGAIKRAWKQGRREML